MNGTDLDSSSVNLALGNLTQLTDHSTMSRTGFNISKLGEKYFKNVVENPSLENILSTVAKFSESNETDPDELELQQLMKDIVNEDL